ncbi:hypothetical protein BGZ49_004546 [Haplosporangium sp. Z 27]|nr:hypothetical protein BGZ49_004546 [Haplosporangium sp. Z 27]
MSSHKTTDPSPQDDAVFASLVQNVKLADDPASQVLLHVQNLEEDKAHLDQDVNSQDAWDRVANTFQHIADAAREERSRTPLGESSIVSLIVSLEALNKQRLAHVDIQAMRAFANICVDHDANRAIVLRDHGLETIIEVLKHRSNADAIKTACGALLNTTMGYGMEDEDLKPAQSKAIELEAIAQLLKVLKSDINENELTMTIASRVIANLSELESGSQSVIKNDGIKTVVQLLQNISSHVEDYMDLFDASTDILSAVISKESAQTTLQQDGLLPPLLDILEHAATSDEGKTKEESEEDDKKLGEIKSSLVEIVVSTTLSDANMVPIFNDKKIMDRFLSWLQLEDREDLQGCGALCIGNVARSDQHCIKLVHEYHAVEPLVHVVRKATDLKASHAATGVLRNLALPEKNREILGDAGVIQACAPLLKKDNALPLQANIVGIFKRLSLSSSNTIRIISGREPFETLSSTSNSESELETPLSTLVDLIGRTDDFPLKSEGTRTLCNLIKITWGSESMKEFDTASVTALQQALNKRDVLLQIAAMIRNPKYLVLQNEGVIALTLLVTSPVQEKNAVLETLISIEVDPQPAAEVTSPDEGEPQEQPPKALTLLESLLSLVKNKDGKCPDEVRTNVCLLLRNALDSAAREGEDPAYLTFLKSSGIKDTLEEVKNQEGTRPLVRSSIQEVISRLE